MRTIVFQSLSLGLSLVFGLAALLVAAATSSDLRQRRAAWLLTGVAFSLAGLIGVVQSVFAVKAFTAGSTSEAWASFVAWSPIGNHSRNGLKVVFGMVLAPLPFVSRFRTTPTAAVGVVLIVLGAVGGGLLGLQEGSLLPARHFMNVAYSNLTLLVLLGVALLIHLARDGMDRLLWLGLCLYGLRLAWNAIWFAFLSPFDVPGSFIPPIWLLHLINATFYVLMIALALRALSLTKQGDYIPALFEPLNPPKIRAF